MKIGDLAPELASGHYHPLATANSVEGRLFAVTFPDKESEITLLGTRRRAHLDRRPPSLKRRKTGRWQIGRAQTVLETGATSVYLLATLSLTQLAKLRVHERHDILRQLVDGPTEALAQLEGSISGAQPHFRALSESLRHHAHSPQPFNRLRDLFQDACRELQATPLSSRTPIIIDSSILIDAWQNPDGACAYFVAHATEDYRLLTTDGVATEVGPDLIPAHVEIVEASKPDDEMQVLAAGVGARRGKAISAVDLGAIATAIEHPGFCTIASLDADFWAFRDAARKRGQEWFWIARPR